MPKGVFQRKAKPLHERFAAHVQQGDGCWHWTGAIEKKGYGIIWGGRDRDINLLAQRCGVSTVTVRLIKAGKAWSRP